MVLQIREHIKQHGNNPLDVVIAETHHRAYLVANLALKDGAQAAATHYNIGLADVHGAIAFYYDNETTIQNAIEAARELGDHLGAQSAQSALDKIKERRNLT